MISHTDFDACYAAVHSRDRRFDGRFVTGVLSTGIYCRPSCPARTPKAGNVRFFSSPAAAQKEGLRACRRCRPELAPDAPGSDTQRELAARALRLIDEGVGDTGINKLAARLFVSPRHLHRVLVDAFGAGPSALVRMRRVRIARMLVDQTNLPLGRVALAAGFGSVRQFNEAFKQTFHLSPSDVRRGRAQSHDVQSHDVQPDRAQSDRKGTGDSAQVAIDLPVRQPFDGEGVLTWAALHAIPSRDILTNTSWTRTTDSGPVTLSPSGDSIKIAVDIDHVEDLRDAVALARQTFDIDADVLAVEQALSQHDLLRPVVSARPGVRIPGSADPFEGAVRVILGQQVSTKGATTLMGRLADLTGHPGLPAPSVIADAPLESLIGLTRQRAGAVRALAAAVEDGLDLRPAAATDQTVQDLLDLPGIGPWTAHTIALLVMRSPDAWPTGDLALRRAVEGLVGHDVSIKELDSMAANWRPWRGYAALHLWHHYLASSPGPAR